MSDKLTPEELQTIRGYIYTATEHNLMDHIAAVEAERDEAAALLREFDELNCIIDSEFGTCADCHCTREKHKPDCLITCVRAWLAKVENDE